MQDSSAQDVPNTPTLSPWEGPPAHFAAYLARFNADARIVGDSALPPPVRAYFERLETVQAREAAEIGVRKP